MPNIAGKSKSLAAVHEMMSDLHRIGLVTHVASDHRFPRAPLRPVEHDGTLVYGWQHFINHVLPPDWAIGVDEKRVLSTRQPQQPNERIHTSTRNDHR
jgi:hypothetical protein